METDGRSESVGRMCASSMHSHARADAVFRMTIQLCTMFLLTISLALSGRRNNGRSRCWPRHYCSAVRNVSLIYLLRHHRLFMSLARSFARRRRYARYAHDDGTIFSIHTSLMDAREDTCASTGLGTKRIMRTTSSQRNSSIKSAVTFRGSRQ